MMDRMMYDTSMMWAMCIVMVVGLLILVLIIGTTVYVVARLLMKKSRVEDRPLMILKERYAKSEISDDEYRQKRKLINEIK
ncbi:MULTISPECIES: SHOCT domain-containing protein [Oceanobacillus]|uniref:SHOCT domain-containing protein n=1 Tax=Oceanobacillus TaxID=182709 RepID=UPI0005959144|nr:MULTISPECIES: SHOCT domain-containing protein [Oceanobacillus]